MSSSRQSSASRGVAGEGPTSSSVTRRRVVAARARRLGRAARARVVGAIERVALGAHGGGNVATLRRVLRLTSHADEIVQRRWMLGSGAPISIAAPGLAAAAAARRHERGALRRVERAAVGRIERARAQLVQQVSRVLARAGEARGQALEHLRLELDDPRRSSVVVGVVAVVVVIVVEHEREQAALRAVGGQRAQFALGAVRGRAQLVLGAVRGDAQLALGAVDAAFRQLALGDVPSAAARSSRSAPSVRAQLIRRAALSRARARRRRRHRRRPTRGPWADEREARRLSTRCHRDAHAAVHAPGGGVAPRGRSGVLIPDGVTVPPCGSTLTPCD